MSPSLKYSCFGSPLRLVKGSTAIAGPLGTAFTGVLGLSFGYRRHPKVAGEPRAGHAEHRDQHQGRHDYLPSDAALRSRGRDHVIFCSSRRLSEIGGLILGYRMRSVQFIRPSGKVAEVPVCRNSMCGV